MRFSARILEENMRKKLLASVGSLVIVALFIFGVSIVASAQGRGRGGGVGGGRGSGMGQPSGTGVDRGVGRSSDASMGRSDNGRDRARMANENLSEADRELSKHPGVTNVVHMNANDLRSQFRAA